jgi:hypothetical protein
MPLTFFELVAICLTIIAVPPTVTDGLLSRAASAHPFGGA